LNFLQRKIPRCLSPLKVAYGDTNLLKAPRASSKQIRGIFLFININFVDFIKKTLSQAERARCPAAGGKSEAERERKFLAGEFDSVFSR